MAHSEYQTLLTDMTTTEIIAAAKIRAHYIGAGDYDAKLIMELALRLERNTTN